MAIKINTAYKEILTSSMLNEKISGVVGGNEKVNGFDVSISTPTSVTIKPGKAYINGCSIEETSEIKTVSLNSEMTSTDGIVYVVLTYTHETKNVEFTCAKTVNANMVKLATLVIKNGAVTELVNHESINTLNTVVGASADIEAQKIRDAIPSGFTELGQLDYDFMLNNENKVKIKGKSTAYVNGYRVEIPAGTIIDIGKAPEKTSREDLLFLETWKDSDFAKSGQLKWRIRHVAGVDFNNTSFADGLAYQGGALASNLYTRLAFPQGGNVIPLSHSDYINDNERFTGIFRTASLSTYDWQKTPYSDDKGLFISKLSKNKTLDGYVYAIPMFRLYRKPSCGKSMPFEYSKINPTVDYSKFVKLMKEEKAERVVSENIKGRSLVNLVDFSAFNASSSYKYDYATNIFSIPTVDWSGWVDHKNSVCTKPSTTYTLILNVLDAPISYDIKTCLGQTVNDSVISANNLKAGIYKRVFTTPSNYDKFSVKLMDAEERVNGKRVQLMILEGDWTNKEIPEFFAGLKSLGEDDGNLITVKNGVLNDDSYDVNDESQKLITFPEVTHIASTNLLAPTMEASILRGEDSTQSGKLPSKLVTDGTETLKFARIQGRTLHNLFGADSPNIQSSANRLQCSNLKNKDMYNAGQYTLVNLSDKLIIPNEYQGTQWIQRLPCQPRSKKLVTLNAGRSIREIVAMYSDGWTENDLQYFLNSLLILKGDHTATPLEEIPFIQGVMSVGETENNIVNIRSVGKNLFDGHLQRGYWFGNALQPSDYSVASINNIPVKLGANYTVTIKNYKGRIYVAELNSSSTELITHNIVSGSTITISKGSFIKFCTENSSNAKLDLDVLIQIEEGNKSTAYTPHEKCNQNIYLKEPLRSLPNGACDEIIGNKVIRKVGVDTFVGGANEGWKEDTTRHLTNTLFFEIPRKYNTNRSIFCDRLPTKATGAAASIWSTDEEVCSFDDYWNVLVVRVNKNRLATPNLQGFKAWLAQNPMTVIYGLAIQTEEYLENIYEKESIKTYQLDAPLRGLPNGTRDEIKDGVLIRRCGEIILDGSSDEVYHSNHTMSNHTAYWVSSTPKNFKHFSTLLCDKLNQTRNIHVDNVGVFTAGYPYVYVVVPKTLTPKEYLKANPIKVVYELAAPVEIPLTEAAPQTANFSFDGRFEEGNWLRELPSGVRDVVKNGKVIRRVGKMTLYGTEQWDLLQPATGWTNNDVLAMDLKNISNLKAGAQFIHNNKSLKTACGVHGPFGMTHYIATWASGSNIVLGIKRSLLDTQDLPGLKAWLTKNPITILYELATSKEEVLTDDNYAYYPNHKVNTYCGSMYVGGGRNNILNENKIPSEHPVVIKTDFRKITGKAKVEDCKYKKCDDGYNTPYTSSKSKNLISKSMYSNLWFMDDRPHLNHADSTGKHYSIYDIVINPDKIYYLSSNQVLNRVNGKWLDKNGNFISFFRLPNGSGAGYTASVLPKSPAGARYLCLYVDSLGNLTSKNYNIQLEEGTSKTEYADYVPITRYFENTEENDIEDLRHQVSLTGFNYDKILNESFDKLLRGEL